MKIDNVCDICGTLFSGWGNNPWPILTEGTCCDYCNVTAVIPARLERMTAARPPYKDSDRIRGALRGDRSTSTGGTDEA